MEAYVGTSGFSYPQWKGTFYPEKLKNAEMLSYYVTKLRSVELNNTFYRMPRKNVLESWRDQANGGFRFAVKANRRITHFKKLKETRELVEHFFNTLSVMGRSLGPVLFQLPPTMKADLPLLDEFLAQIPRSLEARGDEENSSSLPVHVAMEFRHPSWFEDKTFSVLEKYGVALVSGDLDDSKKDPPLVRTGHFSYLRLRRTDSYLDEELDTWSARLKQEGFSEIFAYFKHEETGPKFAERLSQKLQTE